MEWDDEQHCLRSGSLHSFEADPALREGCACGAPLPGQPGSAQVVLPPPPRVAADPAGRCAAALVYGRQLALLPAMQADVMDQLLQDSASGKGAPRPASVGNSYVVGLAKAPGLRLGSDGAVRDMVFLHGFVEPVLLLLYEATPTWPGRLREARDTCCIAALSINLRRRRQPVIWSVQDLPSDCSGVLAVPRGGVLVCSQNLLLYYAQSGSCVMAINSNAFAGDVPPRLELPPAAPPSSSFPPRGMADAQQQGSSSSGAAAAAAGTEEVAAAAAAYARQWANVVHPEAVAAVARGAPKAPGLELEADGAVGCWMTDCVALLSLRTGQLLLVGLRFEGAAASKMQVVAAGSGPPASCAATLTGSLLFLGSRVGSGQLLHFAPEQQGAPPLPAPPSGSVDPSPNPKRRRVAAAAADGAVAAQAAAAVGACDDGALPGPGENEADQLLPCAPGRAHTHVPPLLLSDGMRQRFRVRVLMWLWRVAA